MTIVSRVLDDVVAHARECRPAECCGLLVGEGERVLESVRAANAAETPTTRFLIDPRDHIAAQRAARGRQLDIIGFYHSHPHSTAYPSPTDLAELAYPGVVYLIVGLQTDPPEIRLFRLGERIEELRVTRTI